MSYEASDAALAPRRALRTLPTSMRAEAATSSSGRSSSSMVCTPRLISSGVSGRLQSVSTIAFAASRRAVSASARSSNTSA